MKGVSVSFENQDCGPCRYPGVEALPSRRLGLLKRCAALRRLAVVAVAAGALSMFGASAGAHGGGLDANGGHHCREAGYNSGKCAPLGSYHCHRPGCVEPGARPPEPVPVQVVPVATPESTPDPTPPPTPAPEPTTERPAVVTPDPPLEPTEEASESLGIGETVVALALLGGMGYGILRVVRSIQGRNRQ